MTSLGKAVGGVALAVGALALVAGCGPGGGGGTTTSSSASPTTTDPAASLWDPCALPDSALVANGLDPATKQPGVLGKQFPGSKTCAWTSTTKWYDLTVYSIGRSLQEIRDRTDLAGFTPTTVGSHEAIQFGDAGDPKALNCYIAVALEQGDVTFEAQTNYSVGKQGDPCAQVRRHADDLVKYLPAS
ncbi:DUF3558 domain-containing protein [Nocardia pseudobrasiliensis]|uniref:Uncharacterized protein DUF3558 n=1 Tax=Nocardia pseudobrasiliensis TaxID=45979 RepID=A0A370I2V9_9NOCA|nr:DUF3558 domain-containing protein [Nocardia pseudobrasiliensis]RDI65046.1 uncharacterized protein DUF3558 [Nocardia pseudobrasiliensis]